MNLELKGSGVEDPCAMAPDLEYTATPEEIDGCHWHLVEIPIDTMYREDELSFRLDLPGEGKLEALHRWLSVLAWIQEAGGPDAAMGACPVIAIWDRDKLIPIDGWRRCVVTFRDYGQKHIKALIGVPKPEIKAAYGIEP